MSSDWRPDVLGAPFQQLTLPLGEDAQGPLVATLVRARPNPIDRFVGPLGDVDVLYVHGWSDYFFQTDLARFWTRLGARFFALDLRKYGRSLRAGQTPGYVTSLDEYDADIDAARDAIDPDRRRRLVLMGHSTGGLTLTLWAARHAGEAAALVLNSPWLEFQIGGLGRQAIMPLVHARARFDPMGTHPAVDLGFYTRAQRTLGVLPEPRTVPDTELQWRPDQGFPTHPGWLAAVLAGHATIARGVDVGCPTLVQLSTASTSPFTWNETMTHTDSVLVVDDIARASLKLGRDVTVQRIDRAVHDVFLSEPAARTAAYAGLKRWAVSGAL